MLSWSTAADLSIVNCYSSSEIIVNSTGRTSWSAGNLYTGGLVGCYKVASSNLTIEHSAALNPKVIAITSAGQEANASSGRLLGGPITGISGVQTYTNNFARLGMFTGASAAGVENLDVGDAGAVEALGVQLNDFASPVTWTALPPTGLGWSTDIWDFSNLSVSGERWPAIK